MGMLFSNPSFLYALSAISIPIIIHLFRFKKFKTVYFSNTSFLNILNLQTKSKTRLKHILVLLARIFAIICLVFAFAQPFIPIIKNKTFNRKNQVVAIYIDNSFSMMSEGFDGQLLEDAKRRAEKIICAFPSNTSFIIQNNDNKPENRFLQNKDVALELIKTTTISPRTIAMSKVLSQIPVTIKNNTSSTSISIYYISDFQKSTTDFSKVTNDSTVHCFFIPVSTQQVSNIYVDSCWFASPTHSKLHVEELCVSLKNTSDQEYANIPVKLSINGIPKAIATVSLHKKEKKVFVLNYTNTETGFMNGKIEISDYPIIFDNTYFISYKVCPTFKVLVINEKQPNTYINSLLQNDSAIKIVNQNVMQLQYASLKTYDIVYIVGLKTLSNGLNQELENYVNNGGSLVVFPQIPSDIQSYNNLFSALQVPQFGLLDSTKLRCAGINYKHPLFSSAFKGEASNAELPVFYKHFEIHTSSKTLFSSLLWADNKESLVIDAQRGGGEVILFSSPCDGAYNTLVTHPIFIPIILNAILLSNRNTKLSYTIGVDNCISIPEMTHDEHVFHITSNGEKMNIIPQQMTLQNSTKLYLNDEIQKSGFYTVSNDKSDYSIACNYDRKESIMDFFSADEIKTQCEKYLQTAIVIDKSRDFTAESVKQLDKGIQLWKWFILGCLFFIFCEILLIRFWK